MIAKQQHAEVRLAARVADEEPVAGVVPARGAVAGEHVVRVAPPLHRGAVERVDVGRLDDAFQPVVVGFAVGLEHRVGFGQPDRVGRPQAAPEVEQLRHALEPRPLDGGDAWVVGSDSNRT